MNESKKTFFAFLKHTFAQNLHRPVFYVAAVIFTVTSALYYFFGTGFFSGAGNTDLRMFFMSVPYISIIILPLITFKNAEYCRFSETLPLSIIQRSAANFLSSYMQFCIIVISLVVIPLCVNIFGDIDVGQMFCGFVILLLYGAAGTAISYFFTVIFDSLVSFILSAGIIAFTDFCQNIYFLRPISFSEHFSDASKGILNLQDVMFYICTSLLFLMFSVITEEKKCGRKYSKNQIKEIIASIIIIVFIFLNSTRFTIYRDLTKDKKYTPSEYTEGIISEVKQPLKISYYKSKQLESSYPQIKDVAEFIKSYIRNNKNISFSVYNPDNETTAKILDSYGIRSQQIKKGGMNKTEFIDVYSAIIIEYIGKTEVIPFVLSADSLEYDLDRNLISLMTGEKIKVLLLCGNNLSIEKDYSYVVPWLSSQGIECTILAKSENIPIDIKSEKNTVLFVFGSSQLKQPEVDKIREYIDTGGNAFFAVSPYSFKIDEDWAAEKDADTAFIDMLSEKGITFEKGLACDISCARISMTSNSDENGTESNAAHTIQINYPYWIQVLPQKEFMQGCTFFWPCPIVNKNKNSKPVLYTSDASWLVRENNKNTKLFDTNPFTNQNMKQENKRKHYLLGCDYETENAGMRNGKITVVGDQYFADSLMMEYAGGENGDYRNLDFITYEALKLSGNEGLAFVHNKKAVNISLYKINDENHFLSFMKITLIAVFGVVPLMYITFAVFFAEYRRSKNKKRTEVLK